MKNKKQLIRGVVFILLGIGLLVAFALLGTKDWKQVQPKDSVRFKEEYKGVQKDNIFVYKTHNEINEMLEKGTGIIYLGFPSCPWCQAYVPYLNEVAKEMEVKEIAYFNIFEARKNNTVAYQKTVSLLKDFLNTNDEGIKRIFVPEVIVVNKGVIIGHNNDTSILSGDDTSSYWTNDKVADLKSKLRLMFDDLAPVCTNCNE